MKFLILILLASTTYGQYGITSNYWNWAEKSNIDRSTVKIKNGEIFGSGTVIEVGEICITNDKYKRGKVLTVYHLILKGIQNLKVIYPNIGESECKVIKSDLENDLLLLDTWVPIEITPVEIGSEFTDKVIVRGYGRSYENDYKNIRVYFGTKIVGPLNDAIYIDTRSVHGDSGGGIYANGKLVGLVYGGLKTYEQNGYEYVWPLISPTTETLRNFIGK